MVLHSLVAWRVARLQAAREIFCLLHWASCWGTCSMSGKTYDSGVTTIEELDQGSLHLPIKHPETVKSQPRSKLRLPASQAGTIPRSYLDSVLICLKLSILSHYNIIHYENQAIFKRASCSNLIRSSDLKVLNFYKHWKLLLTAFRTHAVLLLTHL